MLRVPLAKAYIQRPFKPLYAWSQGTPKGLFLDPAWDRSVQIWPGMVMMKTTGDLVTLLNAVGTPYGFVAQYIGGDGIDELLDANINALAVWVLDPDAEFIVQSPSFDTAASWVDPGNGTTAYVSAYVSGANRGKLCPAGTTHSSRAVARLLRVDSANQIVIGGLSVQDAAAATA